jgi:MoxR-like ATPase
MSKKNQSKLQAIRDGLKQAFVERDTEVDALLTGLISKQSSLLLGPPGTGKSAVVEALCSTFSGNFFSALMSKFTTPEELFGPYSLKALEQDRYERVTDGYLPTADVAFLDEVFKGSSAILNTMLKVVNERVFINGGKQVKVPLQALFGASNELPDGQELSALYDRFVIRLYVDYVKNDDSFKTMLRLQNTQLPQLTMADLAAEQAAATQVAISDEMLELYTKIRREVKESGFTNVSDRKWVQALRVVQANAHLNGRTAVIEDDFEILESIIWHEPGQIKQARKAIAKLINPANEKLVEISDAIEEVYSLFNQKKMRPSEANKKFKDALKRLNDLNLKDNSKTETLRKKIDQKHRAIVDAVMHGEE